MAKAEWINLSQEGGTGDDSIAVSSKAPHTGREARATILTWTAVGVDPIERTVIQEGAGASTRLDDKRISTFETRVTVRGVTNEQGLSFKVSEPYQLPIEIDRVWGAGGVKISRNVDGISEVPGDPGQFNAYRFDIGMTLLPPDNSNHNFPAVTSQFVITGASGKQTSIMITYFYENKPYIEISTGTDDGVIHLDAEGTPVTVEVVSNTKWEIV